MADKGRMSQARVNVIDTLTTVISAASGMIRATVKGYGVPEQTKELESVLLDAYSLIRQYRINQENPISVKGQRA